MDNICVHVVVKCYMRISLHFYCFVLASLFHSVHRFTTLLLLLAYAKTKTVQYYNIFSSFIYIKVISLCIN